MKVLSKEYYFRALDALADVSFNALFARAVLEGKANGCVYTNCSQSPCAFYVVHEYGMSLLFGQISDDFLNKQFWSYAINEDGSRIQKEWMQVHPVRHEVKLNHLLSLAQENEPKTVKLHRRINFKFNNCSFMAQTLSELPSDISVAPISEKTFKEFGSLVAPRFFWSSFSQFESGAKGFELREGNLVVAVAFSAFITSSELELGMEVHSQKRKLGYGTLISAQLIEYCVANNITPVWSCNFSNKSSYNLAQKLGFEPILNLPYYEMLP